MWLSGALPQSISLGDSLADCQWLVIIPLQILLDWPMCRGPEEGVTVVFNS